MSIFSPSILLPFLKSASSTSSSYQAGCAMLTLIPILIVLIHGPKTILASQEMTVYRMKQYDWLRVPHGSRASVMNLELRTISTLAQSYAKKCLLIKIEELIGSTDTFDGLVRNPMVGGILIIVPNSFGTLGPQARSALIAFESVSIRTFDIPIYFARESPDLNLIYQELSIDKSNDPKQSNYFGSQLINVIAADGFQVFIGGSVPKPVADPIITNIETKLIGSKGEDQSPTIVIAAHYDAAGIAPGLSFGADSNGSGTVAILELVRIFSKLYNNRKSQPSVNLVFLLSGAGKFSFLGTKKWIEDHRDIKESGTLADAQLSICLDSLGSSDKSLFIHVPRVPKEASITNRFYTHLSEIAIGKGVNVSLTPEKTYLSDESLNWEHDRFIHRRLPALTLSSLRNSKHPGRNSIVDTVDSVNLEELALKIEIIAEALSRLIINIDDQSASSIFKDESSVSKQFISSMIKQITSNPRDQQTLLTTVSGSTYNVVPTLSTLLTTLKKYSKETRFHHFRMDRKDPEIVFYEPTILSINIYNIKPAIFDLFLSLGVVAYLVTLYLFLINFETIRSLFKAVKSGGTRSTENRANGSASTKAKAQ